MNIEYTVIYPAVNHDNPNNDPYIMSVGKQRTFQDTQPAGRDYRAFLERIFAGWNAGSQAEFPFFLRQSVRSMSVGDVVALFKPWLIGAEWYICDSCGWLAVNATQAQSWLDYERKYGCCSFELSKWKKAHFAEAHSHIKF